MKKQLEAVIARLKNRIIIWCILALVLEIMSSYAPLPFIHVMAWCALGYTLCLCLILIGLLIMRAKHK